MTILRNVAAASVMAMAGVSAQAATFEFNFFVTEEVIDDCFDCELVIDERRVAAAEPDVTTVGTGTLSFDGEATDGTYLPGDLTNFMFDFSFENGSAFDETDQLFSFFGPPELRIRTSNGVTSALLGGTPVERFPLIRDVPTNCTAGTIAIQNDAGTCLNLGRPFFAGLDAGAEVDPDAQLGFFSLLTDVGGIQLRDDTAKTFGRYTAVLVDDGPAPVPLPAALPLLAVALGGLGIARRKRS